MTSVNNSYSKFVDRSSSHNPANEGKTRAATLNFTFYLIATLSTSGGGVIINQDTAPFIVSQLRFATEPLSCTSYTFH